MSENFIVPNFLRNNAPAGDPTAVNVPVPDGANVLAQAPVVADDNAPGPAPDENMEVEVVFEIFDDEDFEVGVVQWIADFAAENNIAA